jgi:hypothetical protein
MPVDMSSMTVAGCDLERGRLVHEERSLDAL